MLLLWDVLKRTIKNSLHVTPHSIRCLPIHKTVTDLSYDMLLILGLYSIWKLHMIVMLIVA